MPRAEVTIYTDGSCQGNPGPGGWAAIFQYQGKGTEAIISGHAASTTNNRMELTAAIEALKHNRQKNAVKLYTDSMYLKDGIMKWLANWELNGWRTSKGTAVKNQDLWLELLKLTKIHEVRWYWVKAHAQNEMNNRVDEIARSSSFKP